MISIKVLLLLIVSKIFIIKATNETTELDELFEGLHLSINFENLSDSSYLNKIKYEGFIDNCLEYDPISFDISVNYLKIYFFIDNYIQSQKFYYQIKCYLRNLVTIKRIEIVEIRQRKKGDITDNNDCEHIKKNIGKSSRNEIYFVMFGEPKECKNFIGLGTFVMLNPIRHGRIFPLENEYFKYFKESLFNDTKNIIKNYSLNIITEKFDYSESNCILLPCQNMTQNSTFKIMNNNGILEKDFEENFLSVTITSQFTRISEVIQIKRDKYEEWLNEKDTIALLKYLFVFATSHYKQNIEVISEKSSQENLNDFTNTKNEYITWIENNTISLVPATLIIGIIVGCTIFFIQNKNNNIYKEKKQAVFNEGIQVLNEIKRNMGLDIDMIEESDSETSEN